MSNNLGRTEVAPGMANPEAAVNDSLGRMDASLTEHLAIDVTSADRVISEDEAQTHCVFIVTAGSSLRTITLPTVKRILFFSNPSAYPATIAHGSATYSLAAGASATLHVDGTPNGLTGLSGTAATPPPAPEPGVEEAPEDGKGYVRKDGGWEPETVSSGGTSGIPEPPADGKLYARRRASGATVGSWVEVTAGATDPGDGGDGGTPGDPDSKAAHKAWRLQVLSSNSDAQTGIADVQFRTSAGVDEPAGNNAGTNFGDPMSAGQPNRALDGNIYTISLWLDGAYPKVVGRIYDTPKQVAEMALFSYNDTYTPDALARQPRSGTLQFSDDTTNGINGTWKTAATFDGFTWTETQETKIVTII